MIKRLLFAFAIMFALVACGSPSTVIVREVTVTPSATAPAVDPIQEQARQAVEVVWAGLSADDRASICLLYLNRPASAEASFKSGFTDPRSADVAWPYLARILDRECVNL